MGRGVLRMGRNVVTSKERGVTSSNETLGWSSHLLSAIQASQLICGYCITSNA